jgi:23S rRNA (uracil1939-C5)-methyltransferase
LPDLATLATLGGARSAVLDVTVTLTQGGLDVAVTGGKPLDSGLFEALAAAARRADFARLSWNGEVLVAARPCWVAFGATRVALPPGAFLQATEAGQATLIAAVTEAAGPAGRIADLFSGCGTFALPLAAAAEVHAAEADPTMISALLDGWRNGTGLRRVTAEARDLFRRPLLADELSRFDAVVIDPPRAGAEAQTAEIARSSVGRVAAVSCNPSTFARDARILVEAGFRINWIQVVDQFRWSGHVELAACLTRKA